MTTPDKRSAAELFAIGQHHAQAGRRGEAQAAFQQSIARDPSFLAPHFALGQLLSFEGNFGGAHQMLGRALQLADGNQREMGIVAPALAAVLSMFNPTAYEAVLDEQLLRCLENAPVDAQSLARVTAQLLLLKFPDPASDEEMMGRDPLWIAFLTGCINTWPAMEARLSATRRTMLLRHADKPTLPHVATRALCAMALQAAAGEYAWPVDADEASCLARPVPPLLAALYCSLATMVPAPDVKLLKKDRLSGLLVRRTYTDVRQEAALAAALPTMGGGSDDAVSAMVQAQYEENPYPRWRAPPTPRPLDARQRIETMPGTAVAALPPDPWQVLIAGCGTGYEAIGVARTNPELDILAIDLSRASLAYCSRMMAEQGVSNVSLRQGDILNIAVLERQFDLIFSTGVLHHMEHPEDGFASICDVLRSGGIVSIALYSARARQPICDAHALINERGWSATAEDIRAFRAHVLALPEGAPIAPLRDSDDFYSISGCRDLAFHVQEHRHSLPEIATMLRVAGVKLIEFEVPADIAALFRAMFGPQANQLDLTLWDVLEAQHPSLFVGMYHLWCQKMA